MLDELEKDGYICKLPPDPKRVENSLQLAHRDLKSARKMLENDFDWSFNIAYNSILQAIRALMFQEGYRPSRRKSHRAVVKFAEVMLGKEDATYLDRMRRKRHQSVYDISGIVTMTEAQNAITRAEKNN